MSPTPASIAVEGLRAERDLVVAHGCAAVDDRRTDVPRQIGEAPTRHRVTGDLHLDVADRHHRGHRRQPGESGVDGRTGDRLLPRLGVGRDEVPRPAVGLGGVDHGGRGWRRTRAPRPPRARRRSRRPTTTARDAVGDRGPDRARTACRCARWVRSAGRATARVAAAGPRAARTGRAARAVRMPSTSAITSTTTTSATNPAASTIPSTSDARSPARPCRAMPIGNSGEARIAPTTASSRAADRDRDADRTRRRRPVPRPAAPSAHRVQLVDVGERDLARERDTDADERGEGGDARGDQEGDDGHVDRVLRGRALDRHGRDVERVLLPEDTARRGSRPGGCRRRRARSAPGGSSPRSSRSCRGSARRTRSSGTSTPPIAARPPRSSGRRTMPTTRNVTFGPPGGRSSPRMRASMSSGEYVRNVRVSPTRLCICSASDSPMVISSGSSRFARASLDHPRPIDRPPELVVDLRAGRRGTVRRRRPS